MPGCPAVQVTVRTDLPGATVAGDRFPISRFAVFATDPKTFERIATKARAQLA